MKGLILFSIKALSNFVLYVKTKFKKKSVSYPFYLLVIIKETHYMVKIFFLTLDLNKTSAFSQVYHLVPA